MFSNFNHIRCHFKQSAASILVRDTEAHTRDPDASSPLVNIFEDESVPIRILKVSPNEIHLVNGDVVPSTCVFLHGHPFIWTPPTVDPMTAMPNGKGWEDWTDDVWTIFDITSPKPGSYTLYDVLMSRNFNFWYREYRFTSSLQNQGTTSLNGHPT